MTKNELKKLIKETIGEVKYGEMKHYAQFTQNWDMYKKGEKIAVNVDDSDNMYVVTGHGQTMDIPKNVAKLVTSQSDLPKELLAHMSQVYRSLDVITRAKAQYYSDVFTDDQTKKFITKVNEKLAQFSKTKSPQRKSE